MPAIVVIPGTKIYRFPLGAPEAVLVGVVNADGVLVPTSVQRCEELLSEVAAVTELTDMAVALGERMGADQGFCGEEGHNYRYGPQSTGKGL